MGAAPADALAAAREDAGVVERMERERKAEVAASYVTSGRRAEVHAKWNPIRSTSRALMPAGMIDEAALDDLMVDLAAYDSADSLIASAWLP